MDSPSNQLFSSPNHLGLKVVSLVAFSVLSACGSTSPVNPDPAQGAANSVAPTPSNPLAVVPAEPTTPETGSQATTTQASTDAPIESNPQSTSDTGSDTNTNTDTDTDTDTNTDTDTDADGESQTYATASNSLSSFESVSCTSFADHMMQRTLELINEARSSARSCGSVFYAAADPLTWDAKLATAATSHSADMAQHNFFSHTGSDGGSIGTRVTAVNYEWSTVGENIAAGQTTATQAVNGWINSPGHCSNLMNPAFTNVAVSCVEDSSTDFTYYWTNVLAAPR